MGWLKALLLYLAAANLLALVLYGLDKLFAKKGKRRIPEKTLLGVAACGGSIGALAGMYLFRHKTLHRKFTVGVPMILLLQCLIAAAVFWYVRNN